MNLKLAELERMMLELKDKMKYLKKITSLKNLYHIPNKKNNSKNKR
jgi:hypothetical protein